MILPAVQVDGFLILGNRFPEQGGFLHFRNAFPGLIRKSPGLADAGLSARGPIESIDVLVVRNISRHLPLLPDIVSREQHERQAHNQPHRLDGGV